jgi:hypothetical protein
MCGRSGWDLAEEGRRHTKLGMWLESPLKVLVSETPIRKPLRLLEGVKHMDEPSGAEGLGKRSRDDMVKTYWT